MLQYKHIKLQQFTVVTSVTGVLWVYC